MFSRNQERFYLLNNLKENIRKFLLQNQKNIIQQRHLLNMDLRNIDVLNAVTYSIQWIQMLQFVVTLNVWVNILSYIQIIQEILHQNKF